MKTSLTVAWLALICSSGLIPAQAQVTGISYSFSPSAEYIRFGDASGLTPGVGFGGEVGFGFGEYLEVSGLLLFAPGLSTDWSGAPDGFLRADLPDFSRNLQSLRSIASRDVNARRYGGRIRVNVGDFKFNPYITAGTGVFRMSPDGLGAASVIYGELGVGATFSALDRFTVSLGLQNMSYRLNPASTLLSTDEIAGIGVTADDFVQLRSRNIGIVASMRLYLAGRSEGRLTEMDRAMLSQFSGGNFRVAIEPTYGQINFNSALGMTGPRAVAGIGAGFDLGPYIGIRGFYWRDTEQVKALDGGFPNGFGKAAFYGGELQLRFDEQLSRGLTPYMILGGGFFDNNGEPGYTSDDGTVFDSRYFATAGGGIELPLGSALRLHGAVRGLFMSSQNVEDIATPSAVVGSAMITAGVNFNIGGSGRTLGRSIDDRFASERAESDLRQQSSEARQAEVETRQARLEDQLVSMQAKLDSVNAISAGTASLISLDSTGVSHSSDTRTVHSPAASTGTVVKPTVEGVPANYVSSERVVIPIPTVGEIYIRYGEVVESSSDIMAPPIVIDGSGRIMQAGLMSEPSLSAEAIRAIVRQELSSSETALRKSNEEAIGEAEERFSRRLAAEMAQLRGLGVSADSTRDVSADSTADSTQVRQVSLEPEVDTAPAVEAGSPAVQDIPVRNVSGQSAPVEGMGGVGIDSMKVDSVKVDSMKVDSVKVDSVKVDSMKVDSMKVDSMKVDSLGVGSVKADSAGVGGAGIGAADGSQEKAGTSRTAEGLVARIRTVQ